MNTAALTTGALNTGNEVDLPFLRGDNEFLAQQADRIITRAQLLAEIEDLAVRLPDRPYVVNLCADRYHFIVAWAAAMLRTQVTLLPTGRDAAAIAALRVDYPTLYILTDEDAANQTPGLYFTYPKCLGPKCLNQGTANRIPAFPADQIAAVLFTSGSTGRPAPSIRRWGRLVRGSLAAGVALGVERFPGAAVVATVPHAHSYGLESAVMLPLQHGLLLTAGRPFFPADVAAALTGATTGARQPGILITTPVHLRALVGDVANDHAGVAPRLSAGFVLSATAPLSAELAARTEQAFGTPVYEIYGCSEAGQLATRRTIEGPEWRCLAGFELKQDAAGTWAAGPDEDDVLLADEIELTGGAGFHLQGRKADMVNVAGKRSSLSYLTRQLLDIEGVEDGVFLMPDDGEAIGTPRLAAIVVAPGIDAAAILTALRDRIDPAFLPRPLHVAGTLPRDALGKLPRAELLRLLGSIAAPSTIHFPADHPTGPGHFPNNPIIPGAVLINELIALLFPDGWIGEIEAAKFHHPVRPGDTLTVACKSTGASTRFECRLVDAGKLVLSGALRSTTLPG